MALPLESLGFSNAAAVAIAEHPVLVYSRVLSAEFSRQPHDRTRAEGTTLHGILCAAVAVAAREIDSRLNDSPLRIVSPVDIRSVLGLEEQCTLSMSACETSIERDTHRSIWDLARKLRNDIRPFKTKTGNEGILTALNQAAASNMAVVDAAQLL